MMLNFRNVGRLMRKAIEQPHYALQALRARSRSLASYHLGRGRSAAPETISLFLTFKCNLRCAMCGQWGSEGSSLLLKPAVLQSTLSLTEIEALVDDVASYGPAITLFGGEPMLYRQWLEVVKYVKSKGMRCNMVTNGMSIEKAAEDIVAAGLDEIIVSVDGDRAAHDQSRGLVGSYDRIREGLSALAAAKRTRNATAPYIKLSTTINENNWQHLSTVVDAANELGAAEVTIGHLLYLDQETCQLHNQQFSRRFGAPCNEWHGFVRQGRPDIDPDRLIQSMEAIKKMPSSASLFFYPNFTHDEIRRYYSGGAFVPTSYKGRCMSLWMAAYVLPDGDVRAYHSMDYRLGNIKEESFTTIWNNERFRDYRRHVKKIKRFPVCARGCTELYRY